MARSSLFALVAGLTAAGVLAAVELTRDPALEAPPELQAAAKAIDGLVAEKAAAVRSRAVTLAGSRAIRSVVPTDVATAENLIPDDLGFERENGETLELGQVFKDGRVISLRRIPRESKAAPPLKEPGARVAVVEDHLVVSEVVEATPWDDYRADELTGRVAVSRDVEAAALQAVLDRIGVPARLEADGRAVAATADRLDDGLPAAEATLAQIAGTRVLAAKIESARTPVLGYAAALVALASIALAAVLWRRRAPATATPPPAMVTPVPVAPSTATPVPPGTDGPARLEPPGPAEQVGRYKLERLLATGGMAAVYLARVVGAAGFEKTIALKVLHGELARNQRAVEYLLEEARIVSRLTHPNILQVLDLGQAGGSYFIAMELVDGSDLDALLISARARGAQAPPAVALAILRKICAGLHAAHTAKGADGTPLDIVHRDMKPGNVLLSRDGAVKVADFGIARAAQVERRRTNQGEVLGTAAYMPPEQRAGHSLDQRADVYSVGAIAYELFAGTAVDLDLVKLAHLGREGWPHLPPPSQVRPGLPEGIDQVVMKALAFDPAARHASCGVFEEALDRLAERHGLNVGEKAIAQWLTAELAARS